MTQIEKLFFDLVRVAIGNQMCLSHTPRSTSSGQAQADEWGELYAMAKKQSLVGICFAGVQRLQKQQQCPPEMLYLKWMGMAAKIQQRNEVVNRQCAELQKVLNEAGLESAILKGQGAALLYHEHLRELRQSGDIDVYVKGGMQAAMDWSRKFGSLQDYDYVHTHADFFKDTEVEVHYRYGCLYNLRANKRLQKWFDQHEQFVNVSVADSSIRVPSAEFNLVYMLHHMYRHLFVEGIGLRQVMDYYYVLLAAKVSPEKKQEIQSALSSLGMLKFMRAVMWIMQNVFHLESELLICDMDEKEGRYLLNEILQMGNFGQYDERFKFAGNGRLQQMFAILRHSMHLMRRYPMEALSAPVWHMYHYVWKRTSGKI